MINHCSEVVAVRKYLGLEIKEAAELMGVSVRYWQYFEKAERAPSVELLHYLDRLCLFVKKTLLETTDRDYKSLPYYLSYEDFSDNFDSPEVYKWRLWQTLLSHLRINGKCLELTNSGKINKNLSIYKKFNTFLKNNK